MTKLLILALLALPAWAVVGTPVLLNLTDRSTVTRTGNVIIAGIPVAESFAVTDVQNLAITTAPSNLCAGGVQIDSHRLVTERWHGDPTDTGKSIKWVLVTIAAPTLAGSGVAHVCLADRSGADPGTATTVTVNAADTCADATVCTTISTGINKYWIRHDYFNLFDQVRRISDNHDYVTHSTSGGIVAVTSAGTFSSAVVPTVTPGIPGYVITTEEGTTVATANEAGANLYAQIAVSGALWNGTVPLYQYTGRLRLFGGMGDVQWAGTNIYSVDMFDPTKQPLSVGLVLPTQLGNSLTATFGKVYNDKSQTSAVAMTNTDNVYFSQYDSGNMVSNTMPCIGGSNMATPVTCAATGGTNSVATPWYMCSGQTASNAATALYCPGLDLPGYRIVKGTTTQVTGTQGDGWLGLNDGTDTINVWMRNCWQVFPCEIEANGKTIAVYQWPKHGDSLVDGRSTGDLTATVNYKHAMTVAQQAGFGHYWPWQPGAAMNMTPETSNPRGINSIIAQIAGQPLRISGAGVQYQLNDSPCNAGTGPSSCAFYKPCTLSGGVCTFDASKARLVFFGRASGTWIGLNGFMYAMAVNNGSGAVSTVASGTNLFPVLDIFKTDGTPLDASGFGTIPAGALGNGASPTWYLGTTSTNGHGQSDSFGRPLEVWMNFSSGDGAPANDSARWRDTLLFTNADYFVDTSLVFGHAHKKDAAAFQRPEGEVDNAFNNLRKRAVVQNVFGIYYGLELYGFPPAGTGQRYIASISRRKYDAGYWLQFARTEDPVYFQMGQAVINATEVEMQHLPQAIVTSAYAGVGLDHTAANPAASTFWDTKHYVDVNNNLVVKHDGSLICTEGEGGSIWFPITNTGDVYSGGGSVNVNPCSDSQQPGLDYPTTSLKFAYNFLGNPRSKELIQSAANHLIYASNNGANVRTLAALDENSTVYIGGCFGRALAGGFQASTDAAAILGNGTVNYLSIGDGCFKAHIEDKQTALLSDFTQNPTGQLFDGSSVGPLFATPGPTANTHYGSNFFADSWLYWSFADYVDYKGNVTVSPPSYATGKSALNVRTALNNFAEGAMGWFNLTNKTGGFYMQHFGGGRAVADSYVFTGGAEKLKAIKRLLDFSAEAADDDVKVTGCNQLGGTTIVGDFAVVGGSERGVPVAPNCGPTAGASPPAAFNLQTSPNPNATSFQAPDIHDAGLLISAIPYLEYPLVGQSPAKPDFPPTFVIIPTAGATNGPLKIITTTNGSAWTFDIAVRAGSTNLVDFANLTIPTPRSGDISVTVINPSNATVTGVTAVDSGGDTYTGNTITFKTPTQMWPPGAGGGADSLCPGAPKPPSINYTVDGLNNKDNRVFHFSVPAGAAGEYTIQTSVVNCTATELSGGALLPEANIHSLSLLGISTSTASIVACTGACTATNQYISTDLNSIFYFNVPIGVSKLQVNSSLRTTLLDPNGNLYRGGTTKTLPLVDGFWAIKHQHESSAQSSYPFYLGGVGGVKPLLSPSPQVYYNSPNYSNQGTLNLNSGAIPITTLNFSGCANTAAPHGGTTNVAYSPTVQETVTAGCGAGTAAYAVISGNPPPGMTVSGSGLISGTPTLAGTYPFVIHTTNLAVNPPDTQQQIIISAPAVCAISSGQVPFASGTQNIVYSYTPLTSNCSPPNGWTITAGSLPTGLTLNATTGVISGTPTGSGLSSFTIRVADSLANASSLATSINIIAAAICMITTTSPLNNGAVGVAYSTTLATNNCGTVTGSGWVVTAGSLPTGLTLHSTTGIIDGTPSAPALYSFTVQFNETGGANPTAAFQISAQTTPTITNITVANGNVGAAYSYQVNVAGGVAPYTWAVISGALPTGLSLGASTGLISGTPTVTGTFTFQIRVTDSLAATDTFDTPPTVFIEATGGSLVNVTASGALR